MIGVFDSGYGGLTVFKEFLRLMPEYDFVYLGDSARTPYGNRSFEVIYKYTLQAVNALFELGCPLVILACNTASARALRAIQQNDLPELCPDNRVLGVIRPVVEQVVEIGAKYIGVLGTEGTVRSESYVIELKKLDPDLHIVQESCPTWVSLVENGELDNPGTDYFVSKHIRNILHKDPNLDTIILACTHYPLLRHTIEKFVPKRVRIVSQGEIVAQKLMDYLRRHPEMSDRVSKASKRRILTTESKEVFGRYAGMFLGQEVEIEQIELYPVSVKRSQG